jgi:hypothetical protein
LYSTNVVTSIENLAPNSKAISRTLDFEVSQGDICNTSSLITINPAYDSRDMDWECGIPVVDDVPLHFTVNIRDVADPDRNSVGIKRSQSMKQMKNTLRNLKDKMFSRESMYQLDHKAGMKHSDSVSSFNSISSLGFQVEQNVPTNSKVTLKIGQFTICDVPDWTKAFTGGVENCSINLYQSDWDQSKKKLFSKPVPMTLLAQVNFQVIFLPSQKTYGVDLLPRSLTEYRNHLSDVSLHQRIWKEGFLHQKGGDCDV